MPASSRRESRRPWRKCSAGCVSVSLRRAKSTPTKPSGAHTCIRRTGAGWTRLAVRSATQPLAKVSRAWARSSLPPSTAAPNASTVRTGEPHQRQHQIQIVNHQVEHDADVGRAAGEAAAALAGDVLGLQRQPLHLFKGGIEAFDVADLQHGSAPLGGGDQFLGLGEVGGQRLLDQHGDAARQEVGGDGVMGEGGGGDDGGVHQRRQGGVVGKGPRAAAEGDGLGLGGVRVGDADQFHVRHGRQDAGVFLAQMADADHSQPQTLHRARSSVTRGLRPAPHAAERRGAAAGGAGAGSRCTVCAPGSTFSGCPER